VRISSAYGKTAPPPKFEGIHSHFLLSNTSLPTLAGKPLAGAHEFRLRVSSKHKHRVTGLGPQFSVEHTHIRILPVPITSCSDSCSVRSCILRRLHVSVSVYILELLRRYRKISLPFYCKDIVTQETKLHLPKDTKRTANPVGRRAQSGRAQGKAVLHNIVYINKNTTHIWT